MGAIDLDTIAPLHWPTPAFEQAQGVGMTSQRTRDRLIAQLWQEGIRHPAVLSAMRVTPRHLFVDEALASRAYENTPLPIGYDQTISQPYIVGLMTQFLAESGTPLGRVLEVGTGSGYQTAILAQLADAVYTVERIAPLQQRAKAILDKLGLNNIHYRISDGSLGWPEVAPFAAILSAASPPTIPQSLIEQLDLGGRLVMPVGETTQRLIGIERLSTGLKTYDLGPVRFVPMRPGVEA
ncbi:MAG TPA: protein-L-isoaspartate(D-aspartate) O-methyltransferase [Piscirickettsiaceae bacterium]|nr:protein-L-isoaspartate(D-aspartate) O-methyltransferase [Piscirickettsiaceae bacterium]